MQAKIAKVKQIIDQSNNIVFFGGAGMSTESGIPDFRSADGIYKQKYNYPPEQILSINFFKRHPDVFYDFLKEKVLTPILAAQPNQGHIKLAQMEKAGKLKAVITQNIDGLHQRAGSENVLQLHGSIKNNYCLKCGKNFSLDYFAKKEGTVYCDRCDGLIHPGAVLFGEPLDSMIMRKTKEYISLAEVLIVAGTSMIVQPAAALVNYYKGDKLILLNLTQVSNRRINYFLKGKAGELLSQLYTDT